jgi:hypothetical protein
MDISFDNRIKEKVIAQKLSDIGTASLDFEVGRTENKASGLKTLPVHFPIGAFLMQVLPYSAVR